MRLNSKKNIQPNPRIYYARGRKLSRFMSRILTAMFILWGVWILFHTYEDPTFVPMLIIYIPVAIYTTVYASALPDTCLITSESGIEYKRPEFSVLASWSQIKSLKRSTLLSILGLRYYLVLEAPTILYTKWFGTAYKFQLNHIFFPSWQKRIPLGKMWQDYEELEDELRAHVPGLPFDAPKNGKAG